MSESLRIHFVLEGLEEEYLFKIIDYFRKKEKILMTYHNCNGGGKVPYFYQYAYASNNYDVIYCVYDVDYKYDKSDSMYNIIKKQLCMVLGSDNEVEDISLCTNPNILLILLLGYDELEKFKNISSDKEKNTSLIKKYLPKIGNGNKPYDAAKWQLDLLYNDYIYDGNATVDKMLSKIGKLDFSCKGKKIGSNILPIIKALINDDVDFFITKRDD